MQRRDWRGVLRDPLEALPESHGFVTYRQDRVRRRLSVHFDWLDQTVDLVVKFKFFAAELIIRGWWGWRGQREQHH